MRKLTMLGALVSILSLVVAGPALADLVVVLGPGDNTYNERRCPPGGDEEVVWQARIRPLETQRVRRRRRRG